MKMFSKARRTPTPATRFIFSDPQLHASVIEPDPARLMWMEELREFLRAPGVHLDQIASLEHLYADYCSRWHAAAPEQRWNPNTVINALGVALGDHVRREVPGLTWKVIAQQGPTTLVLATEDDLIVASPLEDVANRWMARELVWMSAYPAFVVGPQPDQRLKPQRRRSAAPSPLRVRF